MTAVVNITVEGSADEKTIAAMKTVLQTELKKRDAGFHDKVVQAVNAGRERWQIR